MTCSPQKIIMSFIFNWPCFSPEFYAKATKELTAALNKSDKPSNIVGDIVVTELDLGTKPPDLEILEVVELSIDRFRGTFRLTYAGDAFITLQTSVQANPIVNGSIHQLPAQDSGTLGLPPIIAADSPLIVPLQLKISKLKLSGIASLVFDKYKGITLAFKNDPLDSVNVSSTFDHMSTIRRFLQEEIEKLLMKLFKEDIPSLIHEESMSFIKKSWDPACRRGLDHQRTSDPSSSGSWSNNSIDNTAHSQQDLHLQWVEPITGLPMATDGIDLNRDDLVRLSRVLHQPPCLSSATSFGIHWSILSSLGIMKAPVKLHTKPNQGGLALALDHESSSTSTASTNRAVSPSCYPEPLSSGSSPPSIDPRDDPGTLFGGLTLLLPEWTGQVDPCSSKNRRPEFQRSSSVHRFNHKYYKKYTQPASVIYSKSALDSSSSSANSLPTVLPSFQKARKFTEKLNPRDLVDQNKSNVDKVRNYPSHQKTSLRWDTIKEDKTPETDFDVGGKGNNIVSAGITTQLTNLYLANQSISPFSRHAEHSTFRSLPRKPSLNSRLLDQFKSKHVEFGVQQYTFLDSTVSEIMHELENASDARFQIHNRRRYQAENNPTRIRIATRRSKPANVTRLFTLDMRPKTEPDYESNKPASELDENQWADQLKLKSQVFPSCSVSQVGRDDETVHEKKNNDV